MAIEVLKKFLPVEKPVVIPAKKEAKKVETKKTPILDDIDDEQKIIIDGANISIIPY
jgi:hypothetical protein